MHVCMLINRVLDCALKDQIAVTTLQYFGLVIRAASTFTNFGSVAYDGLKL